MIPLTDECVVDTTLDVPGPAHSVEPARTHGACIRCGGFLAPTRCIDLQDDTGSLEFVAERCVQCGDVVDPVIRRNRARQGVLRAQQNMQPTQARTIRWVA